MGVDPEERIFDIVHEANMGKVFLIKAILDLVTHKILKSDDWVSKYAPEPAIRQNYNVSLKLMSDIKKENRK